MVGKGEMRNVPSLGPTSMAQILSTSSTWTLIILLSLRWPVPLLSRFITCCGVGPSRGSNINISRDNTKTCTSNQLKDVASSPTFAARWFDLCTVKTLKFSPVHDDDGGVYSYNPSTR